MTPISESQQTKTSQNQETIQKPSITNAKFTGVSRKSGDAHYDITLSDGTIRKMKYPHEKFLERLRQALETKISELPTTQKELINQSNIKIILGSYRKNGLLDEATEQLLVEKNIVTQPREIAETIAFNPEANQEKDS